MKQEYARIRQIRHKEILYNLIILLQNVNVYKIRSVREMLYFVLPRGPGLKEKENIYPNFSELTSIQIGNFLTVQEVKNGKLQ
jgi:hypothetical protein